MTDILIADDHPLFRDALRRAALAAVPGASAYGADSVDALYALLEKYPEAELLLLDLHMPGAHGFSALAHIRGQLPALPIIVVSVHEEARVARRALGHGASAYVPKSADAKDIVAAIQAVLAGDLWVPRGMPSLDAALDADETAAAARIASLTPQQFRVMTMISAGLLNKQIAYELGVSEATVKAHMTSVMRKLEVSNRTQVALLARSLAVEPDALPAPSDA